MWATQWTFASWPPQPLLASQEPSCSMWLAGQLNTILTLREEVPWSNPQHSLSLWNCYASPSIILPYIPFQSSSQSVHTNVGSVLIQNLLNLVHMFTAYFSNTIAGPTAYLLPGPPKFSSITFYYGFRLPNYFMPQIHHRFSSWHVSAWWGHLQVHWGLYNLLFPYATLPTLASFHTLGVRGTYCVFVP
jgi:hypothetical protein